jgi:hypothetical protein
MVFTNLNLMHADTIQITLLKLKDGTRLLRLTESETGLALERALNPNHPLLRQKQQLKSLFASTLDRAASLVA